jgi:predicted Zn-dependent protease
MKIDSFRYFLKFHKYISCSQFTVVSVAAILALCLFSGCRAVPVTGRTQLMLTTSGYENEMGAAAYSEYKDQYPRSDNAEYNTALERCGTAIAKAADQDGFVWEFAVLESDIQNAFCLPGGKVAVYSGLIKVMDNEAELACIVAHEAAHAIARHGGERMSWGYIQKLGALGVALGFNNETLNTIYGTGSELGVMLPFSRSNEYEADFIGMILMARAGYDPQAAIDFWTRFSNGKPSSWPEKITSTHPCDADRIENFRQNMPLAVEEYSKNAAPRGYGITFSHR